jgi:hypothetical protein
MILVDPVLKTVRKQRHLIPIHPFNETRHKYTPVSQEAYHMLGFSHSLGPDLPLADVSGAAPQLHQTGRSRIAQPFRRPRGGYGDMIVVRRFTLLPENR